MFSAAKIQFDSAEKPPIHGASKSWNLPWAQGSGFVLDQNVLEGSGDLPPLTADPMADNRSPMQSSKHGDGLETALSSDTSLGFSPLLPASKTKQVFQDGQTIDEESLGEGQ